MLLEDGLALVTVACAKSSTRKSPKDANAVAKILPTPSTSRALVTAAEISNQARCSMRWKTGWRRTTGISGGAEPVSKAASSNAASSAAYARYFS